MKPFEIDEKETARKLTGFVKEKLEQSGLTGYVLGLSGGIDSALSAAVGAAALGPDKIRAVIMPYSGSSASSTVWEAVATKSQPVTSVVAAGFIRIPESIVTIERLPGETLTRCAIVVSPGLFA